jgi:glycosyltransferase involved in cell wall biosynthesis
MNVGKLFPLGVAVSVMGRCFNVPVVLRVTSDYFLASGLDESYVERWRSIILHQLICNRIYQWADCAVPVGENLARKLVANGHQPDNVTPVPQPFDPSVFSEVEPEQRRRIKCKLGLEPDRNTILTVGRLSWQKGSDRVRKTVDGVVQNAGGSANVQFCLVGSGEAASLFDGFPPELVHLPGFVPRERVHQYFQAAELLIHPSRNDALPNVILEAIAARIPVMASPVGEIPHYVRRTSTDPDDYVEYILSEDWTPDPIPDWYDWQVQRQGYVELIDRVLTP